MNLRFHLVIAASVIVGGCANLSEARSEYDATNRENYSIAIARIMHDQKIEAIEAPRGWEMNEEREALQNPGSNTQRRPIHGGSLRQESPDKPVTLVTQDCFAGDSCGCNASMEFKFGKTPDGTIVVFNPKPDINEHTMRRIGPCSYGCGVPSPSYSSTYILPVTDINRVKSIDVPFELHVVYESCLISSPAP